MPQNKFFFIKESIKESYKIILIFNIEIFNVEKFNIEKK